MKGSYNASTMSTAAKIAAPLFSVIFAFAAVVGFFCSTDRPLVNPTDWLEFALLFCAALAVFIIGGVLLCRFGNRLLHATHELALQAVRKIAPEWLRVFMGKHELIALFVLLSLAWLPYLVLFFPGVVMFDTTWELFQSQGSGALQMGRAHPIRTDALYTDHKPILHTFIVGALFNVGNALGSQELGIFLITAIHYAAFAAALAALLIYCRKLAGRGTQILGLLLVAFLPVFPMYAISPFNDTLAAAAFVIWTICFAEVIRSRGESLNWKSFRWWIAMLVFGLLAALLKKPNAYVVLACCVVALIALRKKIVPILVQAFVPAVIVLIIMPSFIYPTLSIASGDKGEMLGMLFQQTVTYAIEHANSITPEDRDAIEKIIYLDEAVEKYSASTFDNAKMYYRNTETRSELFAYLGAWLKQGLDDPQCYISAFVKIEYPWLFPSQAADCYTIHYKEMREAVAKSNAAYTNEQVYRTSDTLNYKAPAFLEPLRGAFYNTLCGLEKIPVISFFASTALYATWIPLAMMFIGLNTARRSTSLTACTPIYVSMLVLFISPLVMIRYALPILALIPLAAAVATSNSMQSREHSDTHRHRNRLSLSPYSSR